MHSDVEGRTDGQSAGKVGPPHIRMHRRRLLARCASLGIAIPALLNMRWGAVLPAEPPLPPIAAVRPETKMYSGVEVSDPYAWLEDATDPEVIAYLDAENAYREAVISPTVPL